MDFSVRTQDDFRKMLEDQPTEVSLYGRGWLDPVNGATGLSFPAHTRSITFHECGTLPGIPSLPQSSVNLCFYKTDIENKPPAPPQLGCVTVNASTWPFATYAAAMSSLSLLNYAADIWPALSENLIQLRVDRAPNLPAPNAWPGSLAYLELEDLAWTELPDWPGALRNLKLKGLPVQVLPALPNSVESFEIYGIALSTLPTIRAHGLVSMRLTWEANGEHPAGAIQVLDVVE